MASPPPPRRSKRKSVVNAVKEATKRPRSQPQPPSPDATQLSLPTSTPASRSPTSGPSVVIQTNSVQFQATSRAGSPRIAAASTTPTTTGLGGNHVTTSKPKQGAVSRLASALQALHIGADLIPPLKPAISGLVDCLDVVQDATANAKDYEELTLKLSIMARNLNEYLGELGLETPSGNTSCEYIASSIQEEVEQIKNRQSRTKAKKAAKFADDREDILQRYRKVKELFQQLQIDISLQTLKNVIDQQMTMLLERLCPVDDARYNSGYSAKVNRRGCTKDTREQVQEDLQRWVQDPNGASVYWMNGMAGTGKTTIAYSLCEWLEATRKLGASFFCSRASPECQNVDLIIPTIACGLARYSPPFREGVCQVLKYDPGVRKLNLVQQFEKLIRGPLRSTKTSILANVVVVIDALDECENDEGVRLILELLLRVSGQSPLKFFVTSRPESTIRDIMLSPSKHPPAILHLHDIEQSIVEKDIKKYLAERFGIMSPPPSGRQIEQLTKLAGKLFIYAATVTRYILPGKAAVNPITRLDAVLMASAQTNYQAISNKKYRQLDELYTTILAIALDETNLEEGEIMAVRLILGTVVCAKEPLAITTLSSFLSVAQEQVLVALQPLRSVLHVSEPGELVSAFHESFRDYMFDRSRSGRFCCKEVQLNELIANLCFDLMKDQLRFNICKLDTSSILDKDIPDLDRRIQENISPGLFHASVYWGEYLQLTAASYALHDKLVNFLSHQLLFWMEVLNVSQSVVKGISILSQAEGWLSTLSNSAVTRRLTSDANDFVARFAASKCRGSTPHIYISALPFCTMLSSVHTHYWRRTRGLVDMQVIITSLRNKLAQATWVVDAPVYSVATNSEDRYIVSGDDDGNICMRNGHSGDLVDVRFPKHDGAIRSVALSRDDTRIASGFDYHSKYAIQVWNASTGDAIMEPFGLFLGTVSSIAFSPDGKHIVSSSHTCTVRLWDAFTGDPIFPAFYGHTGSINTIALSPDDAYIASGSSDCTIRVWSTKTGDIVAGPLQGHTGSVNSIAFSPDGARIVSGADDCTVGLWDAHTGEILVDLFQGHTGPVNSVAFSNDNKCIISGSSDKTIRVWDSQTGKVVVGPLEKHGGSVKTVAVSPNGNYIASGSSDGTALIWDLRTGDIVEGPLGRETASVNSVAFSHDGACVAWGSAKGVIQVWNSSTGDVSSASFSGHISDINSVAFSCDGTRIVSSSDDHTIRLWDGRTGHSWPEQLKGHTYPVKSAVFSRDSTQVVSCSDRDIRVWSLVDGDPVSGPFQGHTNWVTSVAFSHNGSRIVSGSKDCTVRVWNVSTADLEAGPFQGHTDCVTSVEFSPNGEHIASGSNDKTIRVWDIRTGNLVAIPFRGHTSPIYCVAFSPDGSLIASGAGNGTLRVWNASTGNTVAGPFRGHTATVHSVVFSPYGTRIISGSDDQSIRVWDGREGNFVDSDWASPRKGEYYYPVMFSPNGASIISGFDEGKVQVRDARTGSVVSELFDLPTSSIESVAWSADGSRTVFFTRGRSTRVMSAQNGAISTWYLERTSYPQWSASAIEEKTSPRPDLPGQAISVAFSPDAERIAVGFAGGTIWLCGTRTGNFVADPLQGHTQEVSSIAFSHDGTRIASGSSDKTLVWDLSTRTTVAGPCHEHPTSVVFSFDGTYVASGSYGSYEYKTGYSDVGIWVWESRTGNLIAGPIQGHTDPITSIVFSPDGRRVVSGSKDSTIRVWEIDTGDVKILKGHRQQVISIAVSPDGKSAVSSSYDRVIRVWDLDSDIDGFEINSDGWVQNNSGLLFWAPYEIRSHLPHPCNSLLVGPNGTAFIEYKTLLLGDRWAECYAP